MTSRISLWIGATLALFVCVSAGAEVSSDAPPPWFLTNSAQLALGQIEIGQLAIERAQDSAIRDFAKRMFADVQQKNGELQQLGDRKGWRMPINAGDCDWARSRPEAMGEANAAHAA